MQNNLITRLFNSNQIEFINHQNEIWITAKSLANALELHSYKAIHKIVDRHKTVIQNNKGVVNLTTPGGLQKTTIFNRKGMLTIILFSNSPKAIEFQNWVIDTIDEILSNKYNSTQNANFNPNMIFHIEKLYQIVETQSRIIDNVVQTISKYNENVNMMINNDFQVQPISAPIQVKCSLCNNVQIYHPRKNQTRFRITCRNCGTKTEITKWIPVEGQKLLDIPWKKKELVEKVLTLIKSNKAQTTNELCKGLFEKYHTINRILMALCRCGLIHKSYRQDKSIKYIIN